MEIGTNSDRKLAQHNWRPHRPNPPQILASSRAPTWRNSTRTLKRPASSRTSSRKSTRSAELKKKVMCPPSRLNSAESSFIGRPMRVIILAHSTRASFSLASMPSLCSISFFSALRITGFKGCSTSLDKTCLGEITTRATSIPLVVSTITQSLISSSNPAGSK